MAVCNRKKVLKHAKSILKSLNELNKILKKISGSENAFEKCSKILKINEILSNLIW